MKRENRKYRRPHPLSCSFAGLSSPEFYDKVVVNKGADPVRSVSSRDVLLDDNSRYGKEIEELRH